jgi:hypothetical protein
MSDRHAAAVMRAAAARHLAQAIELVKQAGIQRGAEVAKAARLVTLPSRLYFSRRQRMGTAILPDTIGYRKRIGLVVPSTNTTVGPETDAVLVPGVTCHTGRVTIKERPLNTEEAFQEHMQMMRDGIGTAIDQIMTAGLESLESRYREVAQFL